LLPEIKDLDVEYQSPHEMCRFSYWIALITTLSCNPVRCDFYLVVHG